MRRGPTAWGLVLAAGLAASACDPLSEDDEAPFDAWLAGEWVIAGSGQLEHCADGRFDDRSFDLHSLPLEVNHDPVTGALSLAQPPRVGSLEVFVGQVRGDHVTFETHEATDDGPIRLVFEGRAISNVTVEGTFDGTGPAGCTSSGRFRVHVDCGAVGSCTRPTPPVTDGSPIDAASDASMDASVSPTMDAGTDASPDAGSTADVGMLAGACADDAASLAGFDAFGTLDQCRDDCFDNNACAAACFVGAVPVDSDCGACFAAGAACAADRCAACSSPSSAACANCFGTECAPAFEACAGIGWP